MKFLVFGGHTLDRDRKIRYLAASQVAKLYGLDPNAPNVELADDRHIERYSNYDKSWIRLFPRSDGNYKLDLKEKEESQDNE